MEITIGSTVLWRRLECIVTNACIAKGKYIQVSPKGNGNSPAKYFQIKPEALSPSCKHEFEPPYYCGTLKIEHCPKCCTAKQTETNGRRSKENS